MSSLAQKPGRLRLSKNLLQMKFMQRAHEKIIQEDEEEEREALYGSEMTKRMREQGIKTRSEPSWLVVNSLHFGRVSFGGFNPEVEKEMEEEKQRRAKRTRELDSGKKMDTDVSDKDMTSFYLTMAKKFSKKRDRSTLTPGYSPQRKKPMLKPQTS